MTTYALTNPSLATSSPTLLTTPAFTGFTPVVLPVAGSLVDASPSATFTFAASGVVSLAAASALVDSSPIIGAPTFGGISALAAAAAVAIGSPVIAAPTIAQINRLSGAAFAPSSPTLGAPAFNQLQALTALPLVISSPVFARPTLGLVGGPGAITAAALTVSSPAFGVSWFVAYQRPVPRTTAVPGSIVTQTAWRLADLPASEISETIGQPPLSAAAVAAGAPAFGGAVLQPSYILAASGLATGSPVPGVPFPINLLSSASLSAGSPVPGAPAFSSLHLFASGLSPASPVFGAPGTNTTGVTLQAIPLTVGVGGAGFMGLLFMASGTALEAGIGVPAPTLGNGLTARRSDELGAGAWQPDADPALPFHSGASIYHRLAGDRCAGTSAVC